MRAPIFCLFCRSRRNRPSGLLGSSQCQDLAFPIRVRPASVFFSIRVGPDHEVWGGLASTQFLCAKHVVLINDWIGGKQVNSQQRLTTRGADGEGVLRERRRNGQGQMRGGTITFDFPPLNEIASCRGSAGLMKAVDSGLERPI